MLAIVNLIDIKDIEMRYRCQPGHLAYSRRMLLRLMVQAAVDSIFSLRKIDRLDERGIARTLEMSEYLVREYLGIIDEWKQGGEVNA